MYGSVKLLFIKDHDPLQSSLSLHHIVNWLV